LDQRFDRLDKALSQEKVQVRVDVHRWHLQLLALALSGSYDGGRVKIEQVIDELVRVLGFEGGDLKRLTYLVRH
jgi:hypothetical protein